MVLRRRSQRRISITEIVHSILQADVSGGKRNGGVRFPERGNHGTIQGRLTHRGWPHGSDLID
jgi:hypothetical protein